MPIVSYGPRAQMILEGFEKARPNRVKAQYLKYPGVIIVWQQRKCSLLNPSGFITEIPGSAWYNY